MERLKLAAELCNGGVFVSALSGRQAARLTGANREWVDVVKRASPKQLENLWEGYISLSALRYVQGPTDAVAYRYIRKIGLARIVELCGAERVLAELDRLTVPAARAVDH
jgi:hypothetical protein